MLQSPVHWAMPAAATLGGRDDALETIRTVVGKDDKESDSASVRLDTPKSVLEGPLSGSSSLDRIGSCDDDSISSGRDAATSIRTPGVDEDVLPRLDRLKTMKNDWIECYASSTRDAGRLPPSSSSFETAEETHDAMCSCPDCVPRPAKARVGSPKRNRSSLVLDMTVMMAQMEMSMDSRRHHPFAEDASPAAAAPAADPAHDLPRSCTVSAASSLDSIRSADFTAASEDAPAHPEDGASAEEREDEEALRGEIIDDVLLNNMERQWTGRDFFMEHIDGIAARNLGTSQESDSLNQSYRHTRYESF